MDDTIERILALNHDLFLCDRCLTPFRPEEREEKHGFDFLCPDCAHHNPPRPDLRAL